MSDREIGVNLPAGASPPSAEAIREWLRRTYGREPMESEVEAMRRDLASGDPEPPTRPDE